mmetsp:Transcript_60825/g.89144  ORF Transcript_60825/g.89144 Transcript_60825/m.89144 type:complete len:236 (+) Transcript_60825:73-780(+)
MLLRGGADAVSSDPFGNTVLHKAAFGGLTSDIQALVGAGANVNARNSMGVSVLHNAAAYGHAAAVDLLIKLGADVRPLDSYGRSAARLARDEAYLHIVQALEVEEKRLESEQLRRAQEAEEEEEEYDVILPKWQQKSSRKQAKGNQHMDKLNYYVFWWIRKFRKAFGLRKLSSAKQDKLKKDLHAHTKSRNLPQADMWGIMALGLMVVLPIFPIFFFLYVCRCKSMKRGKHSTQN